MRAMGRWAAARGIARSASLVALLAALLLGPASIDPVSAGDADLARFLLDAGKKAVEKKQYDDALAKLTRSQAEEPALLETGYWIAFAQDRKGSTADALTAYRAFREACRLAQQAGPLDAAIQALLKKAATRISALASGETELAKLNDPFAKSCLEFATTNFLRDPTLAARALDAVLAIQPDHEEALRLRKKLQGEAAPPSGPTAEPPAPAEAPGLAPPAASPAHRGVSSWADLLDNRGLGSHDGWSYEPGRLTIDRKGGAFHWPVDPVRTGKRYVLEMEVRLLRPDSPRWTVGFSFGRRDNMNWCIFFSRSEMIFLELKDGQALELTKPGTIPPVEVDVWHRLAISVDGARVQAWFDEREVIDREVLGQTDLQGQVGLYHQSNRCEIRRMRLGARE